SRLLEDPHRRRHGRSLGAVARRDGRQRVPEQRPRLHQRVGDLGQPTHARYRGCDRETPRADRAAEARPSRRESCGLHCAGRGCGYLTVDRRRSAAAGRGRRHGEEAQRYAASREGRPRRLPPADRRPLRLPGCGDREEGVHVSLRHRRGVPGGEDDRGDRADARLHRADGQPGAPAPAARCRPRRSPQLRARADDAAQLAAAARGQPDRFPVPRPRLPDGDAMNVLSITAGAAGMYCGSCLRDNSQAVELLRRAPKVPLLPLYTPTNPDEKNVSRDQVLFGGISIYLQQYVPFFRKSPRFLDRLWDTPWIINLFASRSLSTDPRLLGDMTVSMLRGERGVLRKEFDKLLACLADEPVPDIVNLPNSLLIALAAPLKRALKRPICCTLQGEDLFLDNLIEPYRTQALDLIAAQVRDVDVFLSVCDAYVPTMAKMLRIPKERIAVVPLGIA